MADDHGEEEEERREAKRLRTKGDAGTGDDEEDEEDDDDDDSTNNNEDAEGGSVSDEDEEDADQLWQFLQAAAQSQGIPMDYILHQMQHRIYHETEADEETATYPPRPTCLKDVADFIQSDACQRILILAGAGMSVISGIPDFRSPEHGLYATMKANVLSATDEQKSRIAADPSLALDRNLFMVNPNICLELLREFILGIRETRWKATLAHRFVELLHLKYGHKLVRHYTQNIDGLEDLCQGLPRNKVIPVHGSMDRAECAACGATMDFATFCHLVETNIKDISMPDAAHQTSRPIVCEHCAKPAVKPSIVLFGSSLPRAFFDQVPDDTRNIDLLLIIGTSLRVAPANTIVWRVPQRCIRVLMNREEEGMHLGMDFDAGDTNSSSSSSSLSRDYFAQGEIDSVILELAGHLGWWDALAKYLPDQLPDKSVIQLKDRLLSRETKQSTGREQEAITSGEESAKGPSGMERNRCGSNHTRSTKKKRERNLEQMQQTTVWR